MSTKIRFALSCLMLMIASVGRTESLDGVAPDVGAGQKRAAVCFACHGADGISRIPGTPHLAGQDRIYLENALRAYRDGQTRQKPTMNAMARPLSDRDITNIAAYFQLQVRMDQGQSAAEAMKTIERIHPVGHVALKPAVVGEAATTGDSAAAQSQTRSGEAVYAATCAACHDSGAAGAPRGGDRVAWAPRLAQGADLLAQHAVHGFKAMPPKGGCAECSEAEIRAAVEHLAAKAR